jgi:hypothetical protein
LVQPKISLISYDQCLNVSLELTKHHINTNYGDSNNKRANPQMCIPNWHKEKIKLFREGRHHILIYRVLLNYVCQWRQCENSWVVSFQVIILFMVEYDSSFELWLPVTTMETNVSFYIKVKMWLLPLILSWSILPIVSPVTSYCSISGIKSLVRHDGGSGSGS